MLLDLIDKIILAFFLSICLTYPVYKFILIIGSRKYSIEEYAIREKMLKKRSFYLSTVISSIFSLIYSIQVF